MAFWAFLKLSPDTAILLTLFRCAYPFHPFC